MTPMTQSAHNILSEEALLRRIRWFRRVKFVFAVLMGGVVGSSVYILLDSILKTHLS